MSQLKDVKRRFLAYSFPPRSPDPHHLAVLGTPRLCQGCSRPPRRYADQAALSYSDLLRQATGEGLPPPLEPQRLTAQTGSATEPLNPQSHARWFLESSWHAGEALYAAFVLVLVLGLRRGEVLGLAWEQVDLDGGELYVGEQLQRVRHQLVLREVKTESSEAPLPLPGLCVTALRIRKRRQDDARKKAGDGWTDNGLVFTTRYGTPIEPRNFNRSFDRCIRAARVPRITVHGTRKTCASLLVALDVHPRVAMRILRHSKIDVTMEVYSEAPSDATSDALRKLASILE